MKKRNFRNGEIGNARKEIGISIPMTSLFEINIDVNCGTSGLWHGRSFLVKFQLIVKIENIKMSRRVLPIRKNK